MEPEAHTHTLVGGGHPFGPGKQPCSELFVSTGNTLNPGTVTGSHAGPEEAAANPKNEVLPT